MRYGKIAYQWWTFLKLQYILNIFRIIPMHIPSTQKTPKKNTNEDSPFLPKMLWIGNAAAGQQLERWLRVECHWLANLSERPNPTSPNGTWNNPKKHWRNPGNHQKTCYLSFLGSRFSHVTVGDYGGFPREKIGRRILHPVCLWRARWMLDEHIAMMLWQAMATM